LSPWELARYEAYRTPASYFLHDFRRDVLAALRAYYGPGGVTEGNKAVTVAGGGGRLAADVLICLQYRRYVAFAAAPGSFIEGVVFYALRDSRRIINYPKPHYTNGVRKNAAGSTGGWYKPTVRMFKNARTYLVDSGRLANGVAPSYFLEGLLYNVPDDTFGGSYATTFARTLDWVASRADPARCLCQNEQLPLFGPTPEQWTVAAAQQCVQALRSLWNTW